jgi:hypothetical protein
VRGQEYERFPPKTKKNTKTKMVTKRNTNKEKRWLFAKAAFAPVQIAFAAPTPLLPILVE